MSDIMLDLETLGVNSRSPIASIGAVKFNPLTGEMGEKFYRSIDIQGYQGLPAFELDYSTLKWWMSQNPTVIASTFIEGVQPLKLALLGFMDFIGNEKARVWGNGSDFDNVILSHAYDVMGLDRPWAWSRNRCYRTMKNLGLGAHLPVRAGSHHNALDDAVFQAQHLIAIFKELNR